MVPKKLTANATQTTAIARSIGHSSSAYSLLCVMPERQRQRGGDDDRLPAPEVKAAQRVAPHARLEQALARVVDGGEDARCPRRRRSRRWCAAGAGGRSVSWGNPKLQLRRDQDQRQVQARSASRRGPRATVANANFLTVRVVVSKVSETEDICERPSSGGARSDSEHFCTRIAHPASHPTRRSRSFCASAESRRRARRARALACGRRFCSSTLLVGDSNRAE